MKNYEKYKDYISKIPWWKVDYYTNSDFDSSWVHNLENVVNITQEEFNNIDNIQLKEQYLDCIFPNEQWEDNGYDSFYNYEHPEYPERVDLYVKDLVLYETQGGNFKLGFSLVENACYEDGEEECTEKTLTFEDGKWKIINID